MSDAVAAKTRSEYGLDPAEVVSALQSPPPRIGRWVHDHRGTRLYVRIKTRSGQEVLAVLTPLASDSWRLASIYVRQREAGA